MATFTRNLPPPAGDNGVNGWRIEDLGYFNPDLSDPADASVKSPQNHTYYRDVCVFTFASSWRVSKTCKPSKARI
jgi:hypothetical protein